MSKIYTCNPKKIIPSIIIFAFLFSIAPVILIRYASLTNSIPSYFALVFGILGMTYRFYHELKLHVQTSDNGLSFKYSKEWYTIKWKYIERIEYKKSFLSEWIIVYFPSEQKLLIGVRTKHYKNLWKEIYNYLCKYNPTIILEESFISRIKELD